MIVFGLTGNIACGKSTVTKTLLKHSIPMVDADQVAREVVIPGSKGLSYLLKEFGQDFINPDGTLNRIKLGSLVFSDAVAMRKLNHIMEPLIEEEAANQIHCFQQQGHSLIGYDAALICEMGHADLYRPLIVVHCRADAQLARLMKRNRLTQPEAMSRIAAQLPQEEKIKLADYLIDTSGTIEESVKQTEIIINKLRQL